MSYKKSHFWLTKSQRNGIFILGLLIVITQFIIYWIDFTPTLEQQKENLIYDEIQRDIDLQKINAQTVADFIKPFNPSFMSDFKGYQLGLSPVEIDRIIAHRQADKYINSAAEFQNISKISDSLLSQIEPYFKFPEWIQKKASGNLVKKKNSTEQKEINIVTPGVVLPIQDLNTVDITVLKSVHGIGEKLATRILKYRERLGGFTFNEQLFEVYYLDSLVVEKIFAKFQILSNPIIKKINVNTASFKEVLKIVYLDYELTKKIFEYKDEFAEILSLEELKNIEGFPIDKFDRIALYLSVK